MQYHAIVQTTNGSLLHVVSEKELTHYSVYVDLHECGIETEDSVIIPFDDGLFDLTIAIRPIIDRWLRRTYHDHCDPASIQIKLREFARYRVIATVSFKSDGGLDYTEAARVLIQHWPELPDEMNQYRPRAEKKR